MTIEEQLEFLEKGTVDLIREEDLRKKLERSEKTRKPLRVKLGLDPTAPDIHSPGQTPRTGANGLTATPMMSLSSPGPIRAHCTWCRRPFR